MKTINQVDSRIEEDPSIIQNSDTIENKDSITLPNSDTKNENKLGLSNSISYVTSLCHKAKIHIPLFKNVESTNSTNETVFITKVTAAEYTGKLNFLFAVLLNMFF